MEFIRTFDATKVRMMALKNGDIFTVKDLTVEFENKVLHEVKFCGYDDYMQGLWERTGKTYSAEELNEYVKTS